MEDKKEKLPSTNINCLITLFATLPKNTYKIRLCKIWNLAFFI
jgi:hypothetical protein